MNLKTVVKSGHIANLTDARYFAARGVDYLGFCFDTTSPYYLAPMEMKAMRAWVEGPKIIGEFGAISSKEILEAFDLLQLDAIQVGLFQSEETLAELKGIPVFKEIIIDATTDWSEVVSTIEQYQHVVDTFVIDFAKNGEPLTADYSQSLSLLSSKYRLFIGINSLDELTSFINLNQVAGIHLLGGEEEKVGFKSYDELDDILDFLEED